MEAVNAIWTFPAIVLAALLIAWAAECGQFYISQGLALAVLAWVQTLPEFAVEAVIAMEASQDPAKVHLVTANFTGSLRLFVGLGWPLVYFIAFFCSRQKLYSKEKGFWSIRMEDQQAIAVVTLLPALFYFLIIYFKGTLAVFDGVVLALIYFFYLYLLSKLPSESKEGVEELDFIPRSVMHLKPPLNVLGVFGLFALGAAILWFGAHPFLDSMLALALSLGVSQFVFVQWLAPFLSEFPEQLSAYRWAASVTKAPMALANFVSSSINQWTVLVATVPFIYSFGRGAWSVIVFDDHQKVEILLTIVQSYLGFLFLWSMDFSFPEALGLFGLWFVQFIVPGVREEITWVYAGWALVETARLVKDRHRENAFSVLKKLSREYFFKRA